MSTTSVPFIEAAYLENVFPGLAQVFGSWVGFIFFVAMFLCALVFVAQSGTSELTAIPRMACIVRRKRPSPFHLSANGPALAVLNEKKPGMPGFSRGLGTCACCGPKVL